MISFSSPFASALVVLIIVSPALQNDFVHDDIPAIVRNPDVQGRTGFFALLKNDFWGKAMSEKTSHKSYRPLTVLTYRINRMLTGSHAFFFHLTNILLHSGLVYRIHSTLLRFGHRFERKYFSKIDFDVYRQSQTYSQRIKILPIISSICGDPVRNSPHQLGIFREQRWSGRSSFCPFHAQWDYQQRGYCSFWNVCAFR
ncbi:unnamed protein product [Oikopleura dioica]|uniref:Uncharacterized protein n=1 Tax=Oikopleura dioica TaxID=34765 RepID=E4Z350_OIKDI|nr:unnamed protein product [Oikopleura dioica]